MPTLADHSAVAYEHTADERVRGGGPATALRQFAGAPKEGVAQVSVCVAEEARHGHDPSLIRTVTVGPGISPDRPRHRGFAGFDRRWGISPRPEAVSYTHLTLP